MKKHLLMVMLASALAATALTGCSKTAKENVITTTAATETSSTSEATTIPDPVYDFSKVAFTYVKSPLNVPSIIEKNQSLFAEHFGKLGLEINYSNLTTGPEQTQALASGDIQFLNAVGGTSVILSAANGNDIKIISMYSRSPKAFCLFSADDAIQTAADLKGKKIAGPKGTNLHELLVAYLAEAGLTQDDVEFIAMGIPEAQAALAAGAVDCALLAGPTAYLAEKDGYSVVTTGEGLIDAIIAVAASEQFCTQYPELIQTYLEAQQEILGYMEEHLDEVITMTAAETELSEEAVREMYALYDFSAAIKDSDLASLKKTAAFMLENEMIENEVVIEDLIYQAE